MPLFTSIATAIFAGTALAGTWIVGATAFALQMAAGIGLNLIAAAIKGKPTQEKVGIQGKLTGGGDVPRSLILGEYNTAGSLVYRNTYGQSGETPNAFYVEVRALADFPVGSLVDVWVDGEKVTLINGDYGLTSTKHIKYRTKWGDLQHLWFRFYDGSQTVADPTLVSWFGGSDRPYGSDRIGKGVPYVVITALRDDLETENPLFNGFPQCKFTLAGTELYDPSKDDTVGGSGSHRYSDWATWGGDGDKLPVVKIYNILRGFSYDDQWLYGLQAASPAILPPANWIAAINKCRVLADGPGGSEAQYRSGIQANANVAPADAIEALLKTCNGRLTEVGGVYTIHVGEPDAPVLSFSDADILSSEEQVYNPFRSLADSINGVVAKYPEPLEGWNVKTSPVTKNPAQIVRDGSRELFADVDLSACPYHGQVQRLLKSAMLEALRERRHTIVLPPWAQVLEPGDIVKWTSERNGYVEKWFRIDGTAYKANLDVMLQITEVDPSDYDWSQDDDYVPPVFAPMEIIRPAPQPIIDWYAEGQIVTDANGLPRRPVIYLAWDGNKRDVAGVAYEISTSASDADVILRSRTDDAAAGSIIVGSQAFIPGENYYARGRYIPSSPRDTTFSGWLPAILPNLNYGIIDLDAAVQKQVTELLDNRFTDVWKQIAITNKNVQQVLSRTFIDKKEVRSQQSSLYGANKAFIESVQTTAADADAAMAENINRLFAGANGAEGQINQTAQVAGDANVAVGNLGDEVAAKIGPSGSITSAVSGNASSIAQLNGYAAGKWAIGITVDSLGRRSVAGIVLFTDSNDTSSFAINANNFFVTFPNAAGGDPVPVYTIANVNGVAKSALRGDMLIDGGVITRMIQAGAITTVTLDALSVNTSKLAINSVGIDQIIANACSNTKAFSFSSPGAVFTPNLSGYSPITIWTDAVNIQSGAATVRVCSYWAQGFYGSFSSDPGMLTAGFGLEVDGIFRRAFFWPMQFNKAYSAIALQQSFTVEYTVGGLSAGNHTFRLRSLWQSGTYGGPGDEYPIPGTAASAVMGDGQVFITDFRR
ncbi:MAG: phage tail protein [Xanthobacteraceae bacterium]